jgi:hypothetical protein
MSTDPSDDDDDDDDEVDDDDDGEVEVPPLDPHSQKRPKLPIYTILASSSRKTSHSNHYLSSWNSSSRPRRMGTRTTNYHTSGMRL